MNWNWIKSNYSNEIQSYDVTQNIEQIGKNVSMAIPQYRLRKIILFDLISVYFHQFKNALRLTLCFWHVYSVQYIAMQCSTLQYSRVQLYVLFRTGQYSTVLSHFFSIICEARNFQWKDTKMTQTITLHEYQSTQASLQKNDLMNSSKKCNLIKLHMALKDFFALKLLKIHFLRTWIWRVQ